MGKISVSLTDELASSPKRQPSAAPFAEKVKKNTDEITPENRSALLAEMARGLPSPAQARRDFLRQAPRVQMNFCLPAPIKQAFEEEAAKRGMTQKMFLLHCFRVGGLDIPDTEALDGRRR